MHNTGFWWIIVAVALYGLIHTIMASLQFKAWLRARLGKWMSLYRLVYNGLGGLTLLPVIVMVVRLPDRSLYTIPFPWNLAAMALQGLAGLGILAGIMQTGIWSFIGLEQLTDPDHNEYGQLTARGLYRWMRHPLYTLGMVFIWLTPVMSINILAFNLGATLYLIIGAYYEERKLLKIHGDAYRDYKQHTPMFIPGLKLHL